MKEFYEYLRSIGKSENTAKNYCDKVRIYNQWCMDSFGTIPLTVFRANVLDYISYMRNIKSYNPKSINNHLSSLRAYNEFLINSRCQTEMAILKNDFMKVQVQYANPCTVEQKYIIEYFLPHFKRFVALSSGNHILFGHLQYTDSMCSDNDCGMKCGRKKLPEQATVRGVFRCLYVNSVTNKSQVNFCGQNLNCSTDPVTLYSLIM